MKRRLSILFIVLTLHVPAQVAHPQFQGAMPRGQENRVYQLIDDFSTDAGVPMSSHRTDTPGPGSWVILDTGNKARITSGVLQFAGPTVNNRDPRVSSPLFSHTPSRALLVSVKGSNLLAGFFGAGGVQPDYGAWITNNAIRTLGGKLDYTYPGIALSATTVYQLLIAERELGSWVWIKGGVITNWTLIGFTSLSANIETADKGVMLEVGAGGSDIFSGLVLGALTGNWGSRFGLAFFGAYQPIGNFEATGTQANGHAEFVWFPADGETGDFQFRRADANNCLILRLDKVARAASIIEKVNGAETAIATFSYAFITGNKYIVHVRWIGSTISAAVESVNRLTATSTLNQTTARAYFSGFAHIEYVSTWPTSVSEEPKFGTANTFFPIGDSKTVGWGDQTAFTPGYPALLTDATEGVWYESPRRLAANGWKTADVLRNIDAKLAAWNVTSYPKYVLLNIGINDIVAGVDDATFESSLGRVLDKIHAKWPNTIVLVAKIWGRGYDSISDIYDDTCIPRILASRSAWARAGIDERVVLKQNPELRADALHPNHAGYMAVAAAWKDLMGK